jgi:RNA polymerase sigma-70 factor, ECF subfamily
MPRTATLHVLPELLEQARNGSTDALGELYRRHAQVVHAVAWRLLESRHDAEDVLQDVFVGLPRALRSYREQDRFEAWLKRLAVRMALARLRTRRRKREDSLEVAADASVHAAHAVPHPVDRIAAQRAIARLPEPLRSVFILREVEGYSHGEIAELLSITAGSSATRLSRAWTMLRGERD